MRKIKVLAIIIVLVMAGWHQMDAGNNDFKFPKKIKFKLLKNNRILGKCFFTYGEDSGKTGVSLLQMDRFEGLGIKSNESLATYIFDSDSSIYADFIMRSNKPISEIRLEKNAQGFDGKKGKIFKHKDLESDDAMVTEIFTKHTVIDLLSMFYITSQRVAKGIKGKAKFNFLIDKSTKIVDMIPMKKEEASYNGKMVKAYVFLFTYQSTKLFKLKIYKDSDDYCFPVSVSIVTDFTGKGQPLELRADKVSKN